MKTRKIIRPTRLETSLPEDIRAKLDLHLYSEVEGRVPFGAYQRFLIERIQEFFAQKRKYLSEGEASAVKDLIRCTLGFTELSEEIKLQLTQLEEKL